MKPIRKISRRSFLGRVGGVSALALTGCATPRGETEPYDPLENAAPRERGRVLPGGEERALQRRRFGQTLRSAGPRPALHRRPDARPQRRRLRPGVSLGRAGAVFGAAKESE